MFYDILLLLIGRVTMGMTTLLTLTAMFGSTRGSVPKVSYSSYLDIWMVACICFVFSSLIEFTFAHFLYRRNMRMMGDRVERIVQITMPIVFLLFNAGYWHMLYTAQSNSKW